jgi:enoyl-CoA hydratase/carnithine racemase
MAAKTKTVHYKRQGKVAVIQLDRPERSNAIDPPTYTALGEAYHRADNDDAVVVVVLHGAGPDFCAGLDPDGFLPVLKARSFTLDGPKIVNPFGTTSRITKPVVVAVQGTVGAMANELVLAADIRIAADDAQFSQAEVTRGTTPGGGAGIRLPLEIGWGNAMRWILTGDSWDASEALRMGLVQEVVPVGEQLPRALALAKHIAGNPPLALRRTLEIGRRGVEGHAHHAYAELLPALYGLLGSQDFAERLAAIRDGREPTYVGK